MIISVIVQVAVALVALAARGAARVDIAAATAAANRRMAISAAYL